MFKIPQAEKPVSRKWNEQGKYCGTVPDLVITVNNTKAIDINDFKKLEFLLNES